MKTFKERFDDKWTPEPCSTLAVAAAVTVPALPGMDKRIKGARHALAAAIDPGWFKMEIENKKGDWQNKCRDYDDLNKAAWEIRAYDRAEINRLAGENNQLRQQLSRKQQAAPETVIVEHRAPAAPASDLVESTDRRHRENQERLQQQPLEFSQRQQQQEQAARDRHEAFRANQERWNTQDKLDEIQRSQQQLEQQLRNQQWRTRP
jgi:hypothetical protein